VPDQANQFDRLKAALADRYRIERELGHGGMATVYLAEDLKHHRKVAVKVLRPELAAVLGAERFVHEITTTAQLQHPHILPLFDSGTADGFLYYVMPYIHGETLRDKLNRETQLGIEEAVKITTEVADALDYAHGQNVIGLRDRAGGDGGGRDALDRDRPIPGDTAVHESGASDGRS
jgi:serine/threonine-protein kinase